MELILKAFSKMTLINVKWLLIRSLIKQFDTNETHFIKDFLKVWVQILTLLEP